MDVVIEALLGPFQYSFMHRALVVSLLVGVMCPVLGVYVVTRGLGFVGDALAHSVLPGMVAAFMLGLSPFAGTTPVAIAVALLIGYLVKRVGVGEDTSVGIIFAGLFALGLVMLTAARGLPVNLEDILLGQVLAVFKTDVYITLSLAGVVLALIFVIRKELLFANFDPAGALVIGLPTNLLEYTLLVLLAVVTVISLQTVGIVLVVSMLITPAATALLLVRNFYRALMLGVGLGVAAAFSGLYLSFYLNLPSGPVMALLTTVFFILALTWKQLVSRLTAPGRPAEPTR